jgi:hypothetical protein
MRMPLQRRRAVSINIFGIVGGSLIGFDPERINLRRVPKLPREARTVSTSQNAPQTIVPIPYETTI